MPRWLFWEFERASWQYDIIVAVLLAFIFFTPRELFRDQPKASNVVMVPATGATMVISAIAVSAVVTATLAEATCDCSASRSAALAGASFNEFAVWVLRSESSALASEAWAEVAA